MDNTFFNIMSYHNATTKNHVEDRLTEAQLDVEADMANTYRSAFATGRTIFVSTLGSDFFAINSSSSPYATVAKGLRTADPAGGDIVLLRPGSYSALFTINQPVTLRATRRGSATLGP